MCTAQGHTDRATLHVHMHFSIPSAGLKVAIAWVLVFAFRLLPFRPPNVEPMLATIMPFSKRLGAFGSFAFGFFGIVLFDAVTSGWGSWTWVTALCYGALGAGSYRFFRTREATVDNFVGFGVVGTLVYDAVTMCIGPVFNEQPLMVALIGQIPFTLLHLTGAVFFAIFLSPVLYRWVVKNESLELSFLGERFVRQRG